MKKILFLSPLPPPFYGSAISSKMCLEILKESDKYSVNYLKVNHTGLAKGIGKFSIKKYFWSIVIYFRIIKQLTIAKYDIIYYVPATAGLALFRDFLFLGTIRTIWKGKIILHLRSRFLDKDLKNSVMSQIIKNMLKCERLILLGKELFENLNNFVPEEKVAYIPNAIPISISNQEFTNIVNQRSNNLPIKILFLSNMMIEKGWLKLLEACKILKNRGLNYQCDFVGEWPSKKEEKIFSNFVIQNKLNDNVKYNGPKFGKEKNQYLINSDLLVFPTDYKLETFGRVIIEAMEYGLPVIANGIGTIPSIIEHEQTGLLLINNTPEEISNCILKLNDFIIRNSMGLNAREKFLKSYTIGVYKSRFLKVFDFNN